MREKRISEKKERGRFPRFKKRPNSGMVLVSCGGENPPSRDGGEVKGRETRGCQQRKRQRRHACKMSPLGKETTRLFCPAWGNAEGSTKTQLEPPSMCLTSFMKGTMPGITQKSASPKKGER